MKLVQAILFGLVLIATSAFAGENFAVTANASKGAVENLVASEVLDNVSTNLRTDKNGTFTGEFSFYPTSISSTAEFVLRIAFNSAGRYRFHVQTSNGKWERFPDVVNPSSSFQTLSLVAKKPLSNYMSSGAVRLRISTGRKTTGMRLDYLSLNTSEVNPPINNSPTANNIQINTNTDTGQTIDILGNTFDADGDVLSVSVSELPRHGIAVVLSDSNIQYSPDTGFEGTDSFQYTVADGKGGIAVATVTVTVVGDNNAEEFFDRPLVSAISHVQPMTGIVLWSDSHNSSLLKTSDEYLQLEFSYVNPAQIVTGLGTYNWASLESILNDVQSRGKQTVLRLAYVLPGQQTRVPNYIKSLPGYNETSGLTEGQRTYFPDWSSTALQSAHKDLYTAFAARYDDDPRIAFLQIGFGLWGEYHIYQPGVVLGTNFPSKAYQASLLNHVSDVLNTLQWSISIDAGDNSTTPLYGNNELMGLNFGLFDDSFIHENHADYNEFMWNRLEHPVRYKSAVHGGEINYYTQYDQEHALDPNGLHGTTFEEQSAKFHISYMLGNDQPSYQSNERIRDAGLLTGYRFEITSFQSSATESRIRVRNNGVAPIYYDAYVTVNDIASNTSLKGLLPGASALFSIASGGTQPTVTIESNRLVPGQRIEFDANL